MEGAEGRLVLRAYSAAQLDNVGYEVEVLRRLHRAGWSVPQVVREPIHEGGRLWCLFTVLPGESILTNSPSEQRLRGQLLGRLHQSTASFVDMGQRNGFRTADELVSSPTLRQAIGNYERLRPSTAHVLRWHLDKATEMFEQAQPTKADLVVLHGDFAPWNLLFERGRLSGIIDLETTHLNYRVSDFALAWRGNQDEVIHGYEDVHPLSEIDRQILVPSYWAWLFLGVEDEINSMCAGSLPTHDFDWQIKHLLRRSRFHEGYVCDYPG